MRMARSDTASASRNCVQVSGITSFEPSSLHLPAPCKSGTVASEFRQAADYSVFERIYAATAATWVGERESLRGNLYESGPWKTSVYNLAAFIRSVERERAVPNLHSVYKQLKEEKKRAQKELGRLEQAISAFGKIIGKRAAKAQRTLSAAARKKISAAQKARWAKLKRG